MNLNQFKRLFSYSGHHFIINIVYSWFISASIIETHNDMLSIIETRLIFCLMMLILFFYRMVIVHNIRGKERHWIETRLIICINICIVFHYGYVRNMRGEEYHHYN